MFHVMGYDIIPLAVWSCEKQRGWKENVIVSKYCKYICIYKYETIKLECY